MGLVCVSRNGISYTHSLPNIFSKSFYIPGFYGVPPSLVGGRDSLPYHVETVLLTTVALLPYDENCIQRAFPLFLHYIILNLLRSI